MTAEFNAYVDLKRGTGGHFCRNAQFSVKMKFKYNY